MSGEHGAGGEHGAAVLGTGVAAVLAGTLLLVQALGIAVPWALVLPSLLVVVGLTIATAGLVGAARHRGAGPPAG